MTEKLYYADPFMKTFTATVLSCEESKTGFAVTLDRTAFYPEGGGQPFDTGTLGAAAVTDVRERDGVIVHTCDKPLPVGETVQGTLCWTRRFDHMQQHSGEHITSGTICSRYHCDNVGFHLGKDLVTIDFNAEIPPQDLPSIEAAVNQYIWEDHPINIRFLSGEALEQAEYRSKKFIPGEVRLVAFPDADCCACCGTHVRTSGQVGLVKLLSCQKFRDGVRIEMVCGKRAVDYCSAVLEQNHKVSQMLSAKVMDTAAAVERTQKELYAIRGRLSALEDTVFQQKAEALSGKGDVLLFEEDMSPESLRKLCGAVGAVCGGRCAVFAGADGSWKYAVGGETGDLRPLAKELNAVLQGRGGGKPDFIQGSAACTRAEIEAFFSAQGK